MIKIIFLFICIYSHIFSQQITRELRAVDEKNKIEFRLNYDGKVYNTETDTISINFMINNMSGNILYIFDPKYLYSKVTPDTNLNSLNNIYEFDLGGTWYYNPGYESYMMLQELQPHSVFEYKFRLIIKSNEYHFINHEMDPDNVRKEYINFNIGYIIKNDKYHVIIKDNDYTSFLEPSDGIYFNTNLSRLSLGPIPIYFYD